MPENSKISANIKRVLLFSIFVIPTVLCFVFYIYIIRKPFLENPSGLYVRLNYYGSKHLAENHKDTIYTAIPDFKFINQKGIEVTEKDVEGKLFVASFICTSCSTSCPMIAAQFFRMQKKLNYIKHFTILSFSVNPEQDNPSSLINYARMVHADPGYWNFLTGNRASLMNIAKNGFEISGMDSISIQHQTYLYLVDKNRHIRGIYDGTSTVEVDRLIDEVKVLDAEYRIAKRAS